MNLKPSVVIDGRDARKLLADILARRPGYTPEWLADDQNAGNGLAAIAARYLEAIVQRLDRSPVKSKMAFLDLAGLSLIPAQAARAPVVFQLADTSAGGSAPARTPVAAPPPPGSTEQILFETEYAIGVTAGKLAQIVSLWPGRDEYIDHTPTFASGQPIEPFATRLRQPTPHILYISHGVLLALSGDVRLAVEFELRHGGSAPLDLRWEYWDGQTWRGFRSTSSECGAEADDLDSTDGLTVSGTYVLETDCATAGKTTVNGRDGYWLRARLTQPLPPDPDLTLPDVDAIRLSSTVNQALRGRIAVAEPVAAPAIVFAALMAAAPVPSTPSLVGRVLTDAGQPIAGAVVHLIDPADPTRPAFSSAPSSAKGEYSIPNVTFGRRYLYEATFADIRFSGPDAERQSRDAASAARSLVDVTLSIEGLRPDKAFADTAAVDPSKPFYPLGQQPQPGSAFYFTSEEAFSKPGAAVRLFIARTLSPQDEGAISGATPLVHQTDWEYWNGRQWAPLPVTSNFEGSECDLNRTEVLDFTVPEDMELLTVNQQEARWVRVRLQSGSYGFKQTVTFKTDGAGSGSANSFTYVAAQPPALASFVIGYTWQFGPFHPEQVFAYNDFAYTDRTEEAIWPGATFPPFDRIADVTPALYLGFDRKPPVDRLGLFFDIVEAPDTGPGPALTWEYWDGLAWQRTAADEDTGYLRRPGIVNVLAQANDTALARFGTSLHWIRGRLKEDGPPGEPTFLGVYPNAVWASERHTLRDLPVGASNGTPDQVFVLTQTPILAGERIEVRELEGPRANVEWRILAMELSGGDASMLAELEGLLAREGPQQEVAHGALRLRRNRQKQVVEAWVVWEAREQLFFSGPGDRHYALDRALGRLRFGDGTTGRVPPAGSAVLVREMTVGGGSKGNVPVRAISQLLGVVPGIQAVFNPRAAEGGADGEAPGAVLERAPRTLRHRGRSIGAADYETLAIEASPAVRIVRAIPGRNPAGRVMPGWVTVLIVPYSKDPRPYPSFGLREHVRKHLEGHAPADLAALHRIRVTGPTYLQIGVTVTVVPVDISQAGAVERAVRERLEQFLHPLFGGPSGAGWDLGRDVYLSDIAAELERTAGVDYLEDLSLTVDGVPRGESVRVADEEVVAAGPITIRIDEREA